MEVHVSEFQTATFGAGCFWGVEWVFRRVPGVARAVSGYAGGHDAGPRPTGTCAATRPAMPRSCR